MKINKALLKTQTPYLAISDSILQSSVDGLKKHLPAAIHYAVKANSDKGVLKRLKKLGVNFEIASIYELKLLKSIGVKPTEVLYSTPVRPAEQIREAYKMGLYRFTFDSEQELTKIAENAPGASVVLRIRVNDDKSRIPLSNKYGAPYGDAMELMLQAQQLGLIPYGLTFHVGSQSVDEHAWANAIYICEAIMRKLEQVGVKIELLNLGGGFPIEYAADGIPSIKQISDNIKTSLKKLPYKVSLVVEPGRYLVGTAGTIVTSVIGREVRDNKHWLYTDIGAFHGLLETMKCQGDISYEVEAINIKNAKQLIPYIITGPTCDSMDTWGRNIKLPSSLIVGDRLAIKNTGAYTVSFASSYNGFPPPKVIYVS